MGRNFFEFHSAEHSAIFRLDLHFLNENEHPSGWVTRKRTNFTRLVTISTILKSESTHGGALLLVELQAEA